MQTSFGVRWFDAVLVGATRVSGLRRTSNPAFTLVEMLVVITIIGILVALLIPTIAGVMRSTKNAAIAMDVQDLSRALETYKAKVGDYPPDFTNRLAVANHMSKAYSRNTRNIAAWLDTNLDASPIPPNTPSMLDPAEALVFWLSLLRKNVRDPLGGTGEAEIYFSFDPNRLKDIDADGWQEYYPPYGGECPYVYFDGRQISVPNPSPPPAGNIPTYAYAWAIYPTPYDNTTANRAPNVPQRTTTGPGSIPTLGSLPTIGVVRPYRSDLPVPTSEIPTWQSLPATGAGARTQWMAPGKFQLICAGQDSHFGVDDPAIIFKSYPTMNYYSMNADRTNDESNIASFCEDLKTLGDCVP